MFKNILLAVDGSEYSKKALAYAQDMAETYRATLWLVHVLPHTSDLLGYDDFEKLYAKRKCAGQSVLDAALETLGESEFEIQAELLEGLEAESILNFSKNSHADIIVMGSRGMGALKGLLLGSISRKVIHYACCPVMVVH
jgi:nucleotide-binding universal stress UspA family protein